MRVEVRLSPRRAFPVGTRGAAPLRLSLIKGRTLAVPPLELFFTPPFEPTKTGLL